MKKNLIFTVLIFYTFLPIGLGASNQTDDPSIFQKMVAEQISEIILETDFSQFSREVRNLKPQNEQISFLSARGKNLQLSLKIQLRGVYRKQICDMPPLKLDFNKKDLEKQGLNPDFDKLKLVTHCLDEANSTQVLLKEFYTYKMYNQISPNSFRVHLVKITYINTQDKSEKMQKMAFLIESKAELASRMGGVPIEEWELPPSRVDKESYQNVMMFNYMIGNLDWSLRKQRNVKLIQPSRGGGIIIIPYDFDFSALVKPSYIVLNADFKQKSLQDRFCIGKFANEKELNGTIQRFLNAKNDLFDCYTNSLGLRKSTKKKMNKYLNTFFDILNEAGNEAVFLMDDSK